MNVFVLRVIWVNKGSLCITEMGVAAMLSTARPSMGRRRVVLATLLYSRKVPLVVVAAATASMTVRWGILRRARGGLRIILQLPDQLSTVDGTGIGGMTGWEGLTGKFLNAHMIPWATVNGIRTVIGAGVVTGLMNHLGARRADCDLLPLAHCLGFSCRVLEIYQAELALCLMRLSAPWRTSARDHARLGMGGSASGMRAPRPMTSTAASAGDCAANRRWRTPTVAAGSPPRRSSRMIRWRGAGAHASGPIRCMMESAVAHRDPLLLLRLPIVALRWIAMGTSYKSSGKLTTGAAAVGRHSAAMVTVKGSAAAGGRPSPWGDVLTVADGAALV